ncbi:hypothetical protein PVAND_011549 [Polypedilum vanderplanki]|uniref:NADH-ubiquinone oxidoreductase 9 kDa subunit n=1 Tax=Polypedilum vanderplanki TaxID=319348 RepID=A0A9J6CJN8_POLVA|nr:hypothetical protein PVAND_011549 [Polypedilum vanderplanki]
MRAITKLIRTFATKAGSATQGAPKPDPLKNVSGLSTKVVKNNDQKAVSGTGKDYQVPEYFGFNRMSYHEAEVEMERFRIPQPVAPRK